MIGHLSLSDGSPSFVQHIKRAIERLEAKVDYYGLLENEGIEGAFEQMEFMSFAYRTRKHILHAVARPSVPYSEEQWRRYWERFESEFGSEGDIHFAIIAAARPDGGSTEQHRVYLRIDANGKLTRTGFSAMRLEKLSRVAEVECGEALVSGRFNKQVITHLSQEGRHDVVSAMVAAGLDARSKRVMAQ